jgi:hypothetical protein
MLVFLAVVAEMHTVDTEVATILSPLVLITMGARPPYLILIAFILPSAHIQ